MRQLVNDTTRDHFEKSKREANDFQHKMKTQINEFRRKIDYGGLERKGSHPTHRPALMRNDSLPKKLNELDRYARSMSKEDRMYNSNYSYGRVHDHGTTGSILLDQIDAMRSNGKFNTITNSNENYGGQSS